MSVDVDAFVILEYALLFGSLYHKIVISSLLSVVPLLNKMLITQCCPSLYTYNQGFAVFFSVPIGCFRHFSKNSICICNVYISG